MADIFVSYTSNDRDWAFWIGQELVRLGHVPRIHEWEVSAGGDIAEWMDRTFHKADHVLLVISSAYLVGSYSNWERLAAQWAATSTKPNFAFPVFVENCNAPVLLAALKRCNLFDLSEDRARATLAAYLAPATRPSEDVRFPGPTTQSLSTPQPRSAFPAELERGESNKRTSSETSIFISYSHRDEKLRDELETHLKLLARLGVISTWTDRKIIPGGEWSQEIDRRMSAADIILLLVSADFIASDYCWGKELSMALLRHQNGEATVIPIMLRPCDWHGAPFGKLQGLPKGMKPVTAWDDRDSAWTDVAIGIRGITREKVRR